MRQCPEDRLDSDRSQQTDESELRTLWFSWTCEIRLLIWAGEGSQGRKNHLNSFLIFLNKFIYFIYFLFIYFWLRWVFIAVRGLSLGVVSGVYSLLRCAGFSLPWLLLLWSMGSRQAGISSCGSRAQYLWLVGCRAQFQ